ncbi:ribonuclease T2 family protein [Phenylobacterium koreense]|uniref:Ribonuclease T2 n=1 Tax=Phenylobacterium koreense TaxID=266125 RepID=A0ABV2EPH1_9CAUL
MRLVLAAIAASTLAGPALAQTCAIPRDIRAPVASPPPTREIVRDAPTASYMLALTWSPQYCAGRQNARSAQVQCRDNRFGFVLHGLWPNGAGSRHPRYCAPAQALQVSTVRKHLCMTPSADLLQHEWAAHGVCGWRTPEAYFKQAAELWGGLHKPSLSFANGRATTAGEIRRAFVAANPQLRRDGLYVKVAKGGWLEDVRVCYDLRFRPTACRGGLGAPDRATVKVRSARL